MLLAPPITTMEIDGVPRLLAGGVPLLPLNLALQRRWRQQGATRVSLKTYLHAAKHYATFCALRHCALFDVSDQEFTTFINALLGEPFVNDQNHSRVLPGRRGPRTVDHIVTLLYSLAEDIADLYDVSFDWYRFRGVVLPTSLGGSYASRRRTHRIKWQQTKVVGLPDEQFVTLLQAARGRWEDHLADGDRLHGTNPSALRGALFYRNIALLLLLRNAGGRRSEVVEIQLSDIDRSRHLLYLVTKGHRRRNQAQRLPVFLHESVANALWLYITRFRPMSAPEETHVFLSHSVRNYGQPLQDESVRAVVATLRSALDTPWDAQLTPHMLRHAFGYELQQLVGPAGVTANMRHASLRSSDPYGAGAALFAEQLVTAGNARLDALLQRADLAEVFLR